MEDGVGTLLANIELIEIAVKILRQARWWMPLSPMKSIQEYRRYLPQGQSQEPRAIRP